MATTKKVEYRVKPVTRYVVTRWERDERPDGDYDKVGTMGEYLNGEVAYHVGYALCKAEHDKSGEPIGSMNFIYPDIPPGVSVSPN